ncbi:ribosome biogenesis GTP-binding protein YihA/YsxC [Helicobacter typhlonius]|uniref:ribosome biogenesis GTP-binding protein YihA/YsxC n=1 Tax=Helicobacter typhlonius TaxID=76936 RepID=UPI002FE40A5B
MIQVIQSHFVSSASNVRNAPPPKDSEIVCLGRSNVGKSTFINAILNKPLAKSSATPGKTQLINFFASTWTNKNDTIPLTFIDLPGFGYAKVSKTMKAQWGEHLLEFLHTRTSIKLFLHLIDSRHRDTQMDTMMSEVLDSIIYNDQCIFRIYTKADKLTQNELNALKSKVETLHRADSKNDIESTNSAINASNNAKNIYHFIFSANAKNHRKMTSTAQMREEILSHTLGLNNEH